MGHTNILKLKVGNISGAKFSNIDPILDDFYCPDAYDR